jgi:hypothetical protein
MGTRLQSVFIVISSCIFLLISSVGNAAENEPKELVIDHVMFPVYLNNSFLKVVKKSWEKHKVGKVDIGPQNSSYKGVFFGSKSFYVEHLSNVKSQPYWSNAVYLAVPKKYWSYYKNPALVTKNFLVPYFGCGYQLINPDYKYINSKVSKGLSYDGFTLLISEALRKEIVNVAGQKWSLPSNGKVRVHEKLIRVNEMAVINEKSELIAPLYQPNPILRELL